MPLERVETNGTLDAPGVQRALDNIDGRFPVKTQDIADGAVGTTQLAANAVTSAKVLDGTLTDADLASPNNAIYRRLLNISASALIDTVAGTYYFRSHTAIQASGTATTGALCPPLVYLDSADYAVAGKTTQVRVRGLVSTNGTVPAITFTFGLYPVTFSGGADLLVPTLGTVVTGTTAAIASAAANASTTAVSTNVTLPANGTYTLGVVLSGTLTNNATPELSAFLDMRHV